MINNTAISNDVTISNHQIAFIDAQIKDAQFLAQGVLPGIEIIIINSDRDGVEQITETLAQKNNIDTIHIVSPGSPSCLYLGNSELSLDTLSRYGRDLRSWFTPNFNILEPKNHSLILYGCNVAEGDVGEQFILKLCMLMDANISASSLPIRNAFQDGTWDLDYQTQLTKKTIVSKE